MDPRTTTSRRTDRRGRTPRWRRRPAFLLGAAAAGAVVANVLVGVEPAAQADAGASESVSVAEQLGLSAESAPLEVDATQDLQPLEDLTASRASREADQTAAQQAQAAADQAVLDQRAAEAQAAAEVEAQQSAQQQAAQEQAAQQQAAQEEAAARPQAAAPQQAAPAQAPSPAATGAVARITNTAGAIRPQVQAAANAVVSDVPGAAGITLGGTRASATDPGGHPSGLALDYMVLSDTALGNAIVQYHRDHWAELGVEYLIYRQRILQSPNGSFEPMEDRGSPTANHMDHVHVNYRG
jgi:hypothetical protein